MRYERLFIERQLNDLANEKRMLQNEKLQVRQKIEDVKREQEYIKNRIKGGSSYVP